MTEFTSRDKALEYVQDNARYFLDAAFHYKVEVNGVNYWSNCTSELVDMVMEDHASKELHPGDEVFGKSSTTRRWV